MTTPLPKKPAPKFITRQMAECHVCKATGMDDSYGTYSIVCNQCHGHGYVEVGSLDQTCPKHIYQHFANLGRCFNRYKCKNCGQTQDIDSGD